jgi:hypothetical protein
MAEKIADGLEWHTFAKQMRCVGMPKAMNTPERDIETALPDPKSECVTDGLSPDGQNRCNGG